MPVILGCQSPHCTASLSHSGWGEWEMTPCYSGTEAHPLRVKKEEKRRWVYVAVTLCRLSFSLILLFIESSWRDLLSFPGSSQCHTWLKKNSDIVGFEQQSFYLLSHFHLVFRKPGIQLVSIVVRKLLFAHCCFLSFFSFAMRVPLNHPNCLFKPR